MLLFEHPEVSFFVQRPKIDVKPAFARWDFFQEAWRSGQLNQTYEILETIENPSILYDNTLIWVKYGYRFIEHKEIHVFCPFLIFYTSSSLLPIYNTKRTSQVAHECLLLPSIHTETQKLLPGTMKSKNLRILMWRNIFHRRIQNRKYFKILRLSVVVFKFVVFPSKWLGQQLIASSSQESSSSLSRSCFNGEKKCFCFKKQKDETCDCYFFVTLRKTPVYFWAFLLAFLSFFGHFTFGKTHQADLASWMMPWPWKTKPASSRMPSIKLSWVFRLTIAFLFLVVPDMFLFFK